MRAVSVSASGQSGVSGFIFPGDRVDVILSSSVAADAAESAGMKTAETIVRNVRVLATDQRTTTEDAEGKREVRTFSTITIEVTPRLAEKIAVAQSIGQLSLALRSIADNSAELERAIAAGEVKVPDGTDPKAEKRMLVQVASRPVDTDPTFVIGSDVSRFQRRTAPKAVTASVQPNGAPMSTSAGGPAVVQPAGPVVRIARGNNVSEVQLGSK
jgi:pilus assembly protein CpaB